MGLYDPNRGQTLRTNAGTEAESAFLAHLKIPAADAIAPSATTVHAAVALTTAAQVIKTAISNPATPRNLTVTGNAAEITGNVIVKGTNYSGATISETIALNGAATVAGTKAFKTITEIDFPVKTNASGDAVSVGIGSALGLPYLLAHNTIIKTFLDNVVESTAPTITVNAAAIESNTITLATALSSKVVDLYLIV